MEVNKMTRIITAVVAFIVALATLTTSSVASPAEQSSSAAKEGKRRSVQPIPATAARVFVYGRFLAGRTWGLLTSVQAFPALIDFASGDALAGSRAAQIRVGRRAK